MSCLWPSYACKGSHLTGVPDLVPQGPEDKSVIEDNDCTFVSDFSKIRLESNTETLGEQESVETRL